jgi:hypothetical protein
MKNYHDSGPIGRTVSIDVEFSEENPKSVESIQQLYGGIKITVDDCELTRYESQQRLEEEYNQNYEYKGEYPFPVLRNLLSGALDFVHKRVDPTKPTESRIELYEAMGYIVMSWITTDKVRIAFQYVPTGASVEPTVPVRSAVGFAVEINVLVEAVLEASEKLMNYIKNSSIDRGDSVNDFEQMINELRGFDPN